MVQASRAFVEGEVGSSYQLAKVTYLNVSPFNVEVDSWTYDAIGNRLTSTVNGTTQAYTYQKITGNPNNWQRLLSDGVNSYTYDADGNTLSRSGAGTFNFTWSDQDQLTTISGGIAASYFYDWQGRRLSKSVDGAWTSYLYNGLNPIQEVGAADYLFGPGIDEPLAMSRGGQAYYYQTDALGSVPTLTDSGGTVQGSYIYDAWGQVRSQTGSVANSFTYTAREAGEGGLEFYRARYYSPGIGRFVQQDPYGSPSIQNSYAYVGNNSLIYVDPSGSLRYNVTGPYYHAMDWDSVVQTCQHYVYGCTLLRGRADCNCVCINNVWWPRVSISGRVDVYYATNAPGLTPEQTRHEEDKHVTAIMQGFGVFQDRGRRLEGTGYSVRFLCELACWDFKVSLAAYMWMLGPYVHMTNPHPGRLWW